MRKLKEWKKTKNKLKAKPYPVVSLDTSIKVIIKFFREDHEELKNRSKLNLTDICQFLNLCLSKCYLLDNNGI